VSLRKSFIDDLIVEEWDYASRFDTYVLDNPRHCISDSSGGFTPSSTDRRSYHLHYSTRVLSTRPEKLPIMVLDTLCPVAHFCHPFCSYSPPHWICLGLHSGQCSAPILVEWGIKQNIIPRQLALRCTTINQLKELRDRIECRR